MRHPTIVGLTKLKDRLPRKWRWHDDESWREMSKRQITLIPRYSLQLKVLEYNTIMAFRGHE